jgi:hypothetical protein
LDEATQQVLASALEAHEAKNPQVVVRTLDGRVILEGTPISELTFPGGVQELALHAEADRGQNAAA